MCCGAGTLLLDADQQVPEQLDEYQAHAHTSGSALSQ